MEVILKDILSLVYLSNYFGIPKVANFWQSVVELNNWHQHRISELIVKRLFGTVSGKRILILGFAFKANTNDTRESAAIQICKDLIEEGAELFIHDPKVNSKQISKDLKLEENCHNNHSHTEGKWCLINDISSGFKDADAIVILTEWEEYLKIDWTLAASLMRSPSWVFDLRSIVNTKDNRKWF